MRANIFNLIFHFPRFVSALQSNWLLGGQICNGVCWLFYQGVPWETETELNGEMGKLFRNSTNSVTSVGTQQAEERDLKEKTVTNPSLGKFASDTSAGGFKREYLIFKLFLHSGIDRDRLAFSFSSCGVCQVSRLPRLKTLASSPVFWPLGGAQLANEIF